MSATALDLHLPLLGPCLRIVNAPEVAEVFVAAMPGWPATIKPAQGKVPALYISQDEEGYWQGSMDSDTEYSVPSATSAVCSVIGELIAQRLAQQPELLGLHCGSVEINNQLVIFPESSQAGKSTLSAAFAAAGYQVYGDDVLGLTAAGEGVAMGVAPRLRLPLPDSFSAEFVEYIQRHAGPSDDQYGFVLPESEGSGSGLAAYTDSCPVGAIVLLERHMYSTAEEALEPELIALPPGEGLLQLLCQNFAHDASSEELLSRLLPFMQKVPCFLFRYAEPLAGARYLAKAMREPTATVAKQASLVRSPTITTTPVSTAKSTLTQMWQPSQRVSEYPLGEELFLIHTSSGAIHRLNVSGHAVWQLIQQEPLCATELSTVIAEHFKVPEPQVAHDITALLNALSQAELITSA